MYNNSNAIDLVFPTKVIKRDGRLQDFNPAKITEAINKAFSVSGEGNYGEALSLTQRVLENLTNYMISKEIKIPTIDEIQDIVEDTILKSNFLITAKEYIAYRRRRDKIRESRGKFIKELTDIVKTKDTENANINGDTAMGKMLQAGSIAAKRLCEISLKKEHIDAHNQGDIHIHDLNFLPFGTTTCLQIPLKKLLANGFNTGHGFIRPPKDIKIAAALVCIIMQANQNEQHGGQSVSALDRDLAPYVELTFEKYVKLLNELEYSKNIDEKAWELTEKDVDQAMQGIVYNLNTMQSRAGAQVPFTSINFGLDTSRAGRAITKYLLLNFEKGLGKGETPLFPNLVFSMAKGINKEPQDPNYDLRLLAHRVSCTRLFPNYSNQDSSFNAPFFRRKDNPQIIGYMGCRTRVIANVAGEEVTDGRGNLSFTSINLPRIAIEANKDLNKFFDILKEKFILVKNQLLERYEIQRNKKVKEFPFLMGQKLYYNSDHLSSEDTIEDAIKNGTLSIGFIGLAETLVALIGKHHGESEEAQELGLRIVSTLNSWCQLESQKHGLNFTLLATPAEGLSNRFVDIDRQRFGVIKGVTDKEWYTNSFHIPVEYKISAYEKIKIESAYNKFTPAGHINYVELDSAPIGNIAAFEQLVNAAFENDCGYFSVNFPVDQCLGENCDYIGIITEEGCPKCQSKKIRRIRRVTGYLGIYEESLDGVNKDSFFNKGKYYEVKNRTSHVKF
ncbi:ribonucleoside-triphosphate reductase class III catalytic subunit [Anaerobranca californiensis DSM 14826]|jgi:ribonucleoside-triphosphate reductase|uniref:Ribonucleoside-triphosphate reductase class III catalytic subunit n=1 Tax=Anaerobranca californiensis DSM 14826 TaxID=1120989 RepID=A0A1M6R4V8_9FIRM|nr:anaerobic ribonucleoside-triphosphate reductase [Anaerobranca californiensis]SHK27466.1 ribonucleoside-triphosphate reductase class III catalytic subunit [Anaerobranca californiensis DSM 14826]